MELPDKPTIQAFRNTFGSNEGKKVLRHILIELGMFTPAAATDVEAAALKEFGARLLELCGIWHEANATNVVDGLFKAQSLDMIIGDKEEGLRGKG